MATLYEHGDFGGHYAHRTPDDPPCVSISGSNYTNSGRGSCRVMPCADDVQGSCWGFGDRTSSLKVEPGVMLYMYQDQDYGGARHEYPGGDNGAQYSSVTSNDWYSSYKILKDCKHPKWMWDRDCSDKSDNTINAGCDKGSQCFNNKVNACQSINNEPCLQFCLNNQTECNTALRNFCNNANNLGRQECKDWCKTHPGSCDDGVQNWCAKNPTEKSFCGCYNFEKSTSNDPKIQQLFASPQCYISSCAGGSQAYKSYNYQNVSFCPTVTICESNINQTAGGTAIMKPGAVTITQNCGNTPAPTTPSATNVPTATKIPSATNVTALSTQMNAVTVGAIAFALLMCIFAMMATII